MDAEIVLQQKLDTLPAKPGCYLFKDGSGKIILPGPNKVCNTTTDTCVQCLGNNDCPTGTPICQRSRTSGCTSPITPIGLPDSTIFPARPCRNDGCGTGSEDPG